MSNIDEMIDALGLTNEEKLEAIAQAQVSQDFFNQIAQLDPPELTKDQFTHLIGLFFISYCVTAPDDAVGVMAGVYKAVMAYNMLKGERDD